jgi:hypothetical protein
MKNGEINLGGKNVTATVKDGKLTLVIDLNKGHGPSKSGKTEIVATTSGNVVIPGTEVKVGLNAFKPLKG